MRLPAILLIAAIVAATALPAPAGAILDAQPAPALKVSEWINGDPGPLKNMQGRVVLIHFFQLWCPGTNRFSVPLVARLKQQFGDREDFAVVGIHTVFEGHDYQSPDLLRRFVAAAGIDYPVGIDDYAEPQDDVPVTMQRFENYGTPTIALVDKEGNLVFSHFGTFDPGPLTYYIERLLKEEPADAAARKPKRSS